MKAMVITAFGGPEVFIAFQFFERKRRKFNELRTLVERKLLRPVVDSVLPLDQVAAAHNRLEQGGVRGKIVLTVRE